MSAVQRSDARFEKITESPKNIRSEFDSRTAADLEVLMMGRKMLQQTIRPIRAEKAETRIIEMRGLTP